MSVLLRIEEPLPDAVHHRRISCGKSEKHRYLYPPPTACQQARATMNKNFGKKMRSTPQSARRNGTNLP